MSRSTKNQSQPARDNLHKVPDAGRSSQDRPWLGLQHPKTIASNFMASMPVRTRNDQIPSTRPNDNPSNAFMASLTARNYTASRVDSQRELDTPEPMAKRAKLHENHTVSSNAMDEFKGLKEMISKLQDEATVLKAEREQQDEKTQELERQVAFWRRAFEKAEDRKREAKLEAELEREKFSALEAKIGRWLANRRRQEVSFADLSRAVSKGMVNDMVVEKVDEKGNERQLYGANFDKGIFGMDGR